MATESVKILIEAEDKATAQLQKTVREQEKAAAKSQVVRDMQLQALRAEKIALEQGAEAAEAYKLTLQGVDEQTAKLIARERALLQEQKQANAEIAKQPGGLKSTKATTEFFGAVSNIAGGSQIASLAGQVAGLTEKTGQFSEVAKAGGASAMIFKGGLAAAAGVIGVQVGQALGNMIFQTEKWNGEVQKAIANSDRLTSALAKVKDQSFVDDMTRIGFLDEFEKTEAINAKLASVKKELSGVAQQGAAADKKFAELSEWSGYDWTFEFQTGQDLAVELAAAQKEIERVAAEKERLNEQAKTLERKLTIEVEFEELRNEQQSQQYLAGLQEQLRAIQAEAKGAKNEYEAFKNTTDAPQAIIAEGILNEIEATKKQIAEQQKLEQQKEQAAQKDAERSLQLAELRKGEIDRIREQAIALAEGKEAAHAFRLEQQGLSEFRAKEIAAEQAEIDRINEMKNQKPDKPQNLQAVESRLLTRGPEQADQTAKNTAEIARLAKEQLERLNKIAAKADKQVAEKKVELELVSR